MLNNTSLGAPAHRHRVTRIIIGVLVVCAALGTIGGIREEEAAAQARSVSLVGDSLVAGRSKVYERAFSLRGVPVRVDGVGSRAIRFGWQCRVQAGLRVFPKPVSSKCKREGLELLRHWSRSGELGSDVVVALGTNDAGLFPGARTVANLDQVRAVIGNRMLWLVTVRKLSNSKKVAAWNRTAREWCATDAACSVIGWGESAVSARSELYTNDGVHLTARGAELRAEFIATVVAGH